MTVEEELRELKRTGQKKARQTATTFGVIIVCTLIIIVYGYACEKNN